MLVHTRIDPLKQELNRLRRRGRRIGFVPTMGMFHEGHLALMRRARTENDCVVVSVFVNPLQFGPNEDYRRYPRDKKNDIFLARRVGVDIMFMPTVKTMYPTTPQTIVRVTGLTEGLCGRSRPGHFDGVATVVMKLLNIIEPDVMYLGRKDYQQWRVLQRMVHDLNVPCRIKSIATVRESDGLAMSSRNLYLTPQQRREAPVLYRSLCEAKEAIHRGERHPENVIKLIKQRLAATSARIDYVECVDAGTLEPLDVLRGRVLIAAAVYFGKARLIDNIVAVAH